MNIPCNSILECKMLVSSKKFKQLIRKQSTQSDLEELLMLRSAPPELLHQCTNSYSFKNCPQDLWNEVSSSTSTERWRQQQVHISLKQTLERCSLVPTRYSAPLSSQLLMHDTFTAHLSKRAD